MLPSKSGLTIHTPDGFIGYESMRNATIQSYSCLGATQIALYELFSVADNFRQLCMVAPPNTGAINLPFGLSLERATLLVPITLHDGDKTLAFVGNFRCPIILNSENLTAMQLINTHSHAPMQGHIFTAHIVRRKHA